MASDRSCKVCEAQFRAYGTRPGLYCSRACKGIASRIRKPCEMCGKPFKSVRRGEKQGRFCSKECSGVSRAFRVERPCPVCAKPAKEPRVFCSHACASIHQGRNKVALTCKTCLTSFRVSKSVLGQRRPFYCSIKCRNACPEWKRNAVIMGNLTQCRRRTPSKLEVAGGRILSALGVKYDEQVLIDGRFVVDAFIPDAKLVIQWDGDYWHGYRREGDGRPLDSRQERRRKLDASQDAYMAKHGYQIARYWEHEVRESPRKVQADIRRRMDLAVKPTKRAAVAKTKGKLDQAPATPLEALMRGDP